MSLKIHYTPEAKETLLSVYNFILQNFGLKVADKFLVKVEHTISLISEQPFMFKASSIDINARKGLITKQCSIFYRTTDTSVHLLFFWDNRQNPIITN